MKVCPKCGNVADTNFCSKCGSAMEMVEGKETSLQEERIDESESENTNQDIVVQLSRQKSKLFIMN